MPVMSGLEFAKQAMEADRTFGAHLILWSGSNDPKVEAFCRKEEIPLLSKPISLWELKKKVNELSAAITEKHLKAEKGTISF